MMSIIRKYLCNYIPAMVWFLALGLSAPISANAQSAPAISLLADSILLNQTTGVLVASGNVQIFFAGRLLSAAEIRYDTRAETISATGPITISEPNGSVFTAEFGELSQDLRDGVIRGARLLLADQLQLASAEIRRTAGRFNSMTNVIASSCQVCASRPTPVWQIRAQQVIHDEQRQRIYFRHAKLEVLGLPVAYLPYFRIPSPEVQRASGFLVPKFLSSENNGNGLKLPYFITLGASADATITPTISFDGARLIDVEYRKRYRNGGYDLFGALAINDENGEFGRGFFTAKGAFALRNDIEFTFDGTALSDFGYMKQFGYSDTDRIVSEVSVSRYSDHNYFSVAGAILLSLRDDEDNSTIPLVLPEFSYRNYRTDQLIGGKIGYEISTVGLTRVNGQDVARISGAADWTVPLELQHGIKATGFARAELDLYRVWDSISFPNHILTSFQPTIGAELRWPLARKSSTGRHIFEPVIQLIYTGNPSWNDPVPNEDSLLVEFDETNLFDLNRYPGHDAFEVGFRANIGATYTIIDDSGWLISAAGGVVLRSDTTSQFSQDFLGAVSFELADNFKAIGRFLFDENLVSKRSEAEFDLTFDRWDIGGTFAYLLADPLAGSPNDRGEGTLRGSYRISPSWEVDMNWTHDFVSHTNVVAGGGLTYGNECIEVGLSLSRRYTTSNIVPPSTDIDLVVKLAGFGGSTQDKWPAARCSF